MKILKRNDVVIIDSNLKEEIAEYDETKTYNKDEQVLFERYIYKALKQSVGVSPSSDVSAWQKEKVSNEYACFDYYLNTISKASNELDLTFRCFGARGIYLHGLRAKYLKIECLDMQNAVLESKEFALWNSNTKSWGEYFFNDYSANDRAYNVFYECKTLSRGIIFRIRAWGLTQIELASIICGNIKELAMTLYDKNSISMIDFSKVNTDEEGNTQLVKGNYKRTNSFEMLVEDKELDYVAYELAQLRGEACVFIISDYYESLINFAFLKNHEILLSKPNKSIISVEIEGLV